MAAVTLCLELRMSQTRAKTSKDVLQRTRIRKGIYTQPLKYFRSRRNTSLTKVILTPPVSGSCGSSVEIDISNVTTEKEAVPTGYSKGEHATTTSPRLGCYRPGLVRAAPAVAGRGHNCSFFGPSLSHIRGQCLHAVVALPGAH